MSAASPRLFTAVVAVLATTAALSAQSTSLEERLLRLESEVGSLRQENQQLRADLGLEGRAGQTIVRPAGRAPTISVGGLVQAQADLGDKGDARFATGNDRFYVRRARLNAQGRFLEEFDFRLELDLAGSLAEATGNRAQLTDGFINWNRYEFANVKVGQFKTPFGYEQLYADPRLFVVERSLANDRLTAGRQLGVQLGGDLSNKQFSYALGLFNGTGINTTANDNDRFLWAGRVSATAWQGRIGEQDAKWTLGANALTASDSNLPAQPAELGFDLMPGGARDNVFAGRRRAGGLDTQLHLGPFDLWFEYLRARFQPSSAIPARSFDAAGWYAQATYFVVPQTLQTILKYDTFDPNVPLRKNSTSTWTLGANWFLKADDIKLQFNYLLTDLDGVPAKNEKLIMRLQTIF